MSQQFDTGLAVAVRTAVRTAVISKLQPLLKSNGLYLRAVKKIARPYRGKGDEDGLILINTALQGQMPAMLVALGDQTYEHVSLRQTIVNTKLDVIVYAASANPRAMDEGRLEPDVRSNADITADPGVDAMLEHIEQQLLGQDLGVNGVGLMQPHHQGETDTNAEFSLWEIRFVVTVDRRINPARAITARVVEIESDHNLDGADPANPIVSTLSPLDEES